jgi:formylmethanofuran dehydrogenase subunit C
LLRLTLLTFSPIPLEADAIAPDRLRGPLSTLSNLPVWHGNREMRLSDHFQIEGDAEDGVVEVLGDCSRVKGLGKAMTSGQLLIRGNAGMHTGAEMLGGRIDVIGDAGDWLGAEMRGGLIHVHGNARNRVGSAYLGAQVGMRGGAILIDGDAGDEAGANMRRGLIAVRGRCGDLAGVAMIAGSLFACGGVGRRAGAGMKRGSIVVIGGAFEPVPTFRFACVDRPAFLQVYLRQLTAWGFDGRAEPGRQFRRFRGDQLALGRGEILVAIPENR